VPCRPRQCGVGVDGVRSVHPAIHEQPLVGVVRVLLRCLCCQCDVAGIEGSGVHLAGTPLHGPSQPLPGVVRVRHHPVIHSASRGSQQWCRSGDSGWARGVLLGVIVLLLV
jgi:hypothetical protein